MKSFSVNSNKGFHITFPNNVILSTQIGGGNYCGNRNVEIGSELKTLQIECNDCEIGIWDKSGDWITQNMFNDIPEIENNGDNVLGYVNIETWLKIFDWCKSYKN